MKIRVALMLACGPVALVATGQVPTFQSGINLVEVYATVRDASGAPVSGLTREDFVLVEDGRAQTIDAFAEGAFPVSVAIGIDRSASMAGTKLALAKRATTGFLRALRPADRSSVFAIGAEPELVAPASMARDAQVGAIEALDAWSTTALYDGVAMMLTAVADEPGRQAVVVFSDGVDRYSQTKAGTLLEQARRSRALVYPIAIGRTRPPVLAEMAAASGGRSVLVPSIDALDATLRGIAEELHHQYLLGYAPPTGPSGWRSITVQLVGRRSGVRVRARDGYVAD
jgi:Ca-activated chloride channel family protein